MLSKISRKSLNEHKIEFVLQKSSIPWVTKPIFKIFKELQNQLKTYINIYNSKENPLGFIKELKYNPHLKLSIFLKHKIEINKELEENS